MKSELVPRFTQERKQRQKQRTWGQNEKREREKKKKKKEEEGWGWGNYSQLSWEQAGSGVCGVVLQRPELKATEWVMALLLGVACVLKKSQREEAQVFFVCSLNCSRLQNEMLENYYTNAHQAWAGKTSLADEGVHANLLIKLIILLKIHLSSKDIFPRF